MLYLFHNKNEVLYAFKTFKVKVEKPCKIQIKIVRSNRDGEYYGKYKEDGQAHGLFINFLQKNNIVAQYIMSSPLY